MRRIRPAWPLLFAALSGCALAPPFERPVIRTPAAYKASPDGPDGQAPGPAWTVATPGDAVRRDGWWSVFQDPALDALLAELDHASPTLAAALARYDQARAVAGLESAGLHPRLTLTGRAERHQSSQTSAGAQTSTDPEDRFFLGAALGYELDLWGRVRNAVEARHADAEASQADMVNVRLSLQTALADAYFRLRGLDSELALLDQTVTAYRRAQALTQTRHEVGLASGLDAGRAETQLAGAQARRVDVRRRRAGIENQIAALVGEVASDFTLPPSNSRPPPPHIPSGVPSELLQRRPDIAAAERRMAAANARIGVARAAYFPVLNIGAAGGRQTTRGALFSAPAGFWSLGPLSATIPLWDGGARKAEVAASRAGHAELSAAYRGTVLEAFREVEDAMTAARDLAEQAVQQHRAADAARRTEALALVLYEEGASDFLDVVTAQTAALESERAALAVETSRMQAAVALIRALGGGYAGPETHRSGDLAAETP
ncbi:efflux transporter outer membrane subunit [uncultured Brevundimonas sp.]|uniref:efflux transporter outer membrane subunit n=1 Tax=uncultured Brevundimonas sp. TaxID=213418 RepID=UPI0026318C02|nr:efflux transporter outer membrane subunit [uncultured Brevundimonas sp.]